jgi:hypothetical protein
MSSEKITVIKIAKYEKWIYYCITCIDRKKRPYPFLCSFNTLRKYIVHAIKCVVVVFVVIFAMGLEIL